MNTDNCTFSAPPVISPPAVSVAFWSDLHCPPSGLPSGYMGAVEAAKWISEHDPLPEVLVNGGDSNAPGADPRYSEWLYMSPDVGGAGLDPRIIDLPVIGNHDTVTPINAPYGTTPADPHGPIRADYPTRFNGQNYYKFDIEEAGASVRLIVGHNLTDEINRDTLHPCYHNSNPSGEDALNPDLSGWTDPNSWQRMWLDEKSASDHTWKIVCAHRPMWSNFDGPGRPMHRSGREAMRIPIDNGVDLVFGGDQHVGCFAGRFHPDSEEVVNDASNGAYALTLSGGYAVRTPNDSLLPQGSVLWSSANVPRPGLVQAAIVTFRGDVATIEIFQASPNFPPAVVFTQQLVRNRGLAT